MKRCPQCKKSYLDDSLLYCLDDGASLVQGTVGDEPATAILSGDEISTADVTQTLSASDHVSTEKALTRKATTLIPWAIAALLTFIAIGAAGFAFSGRTTTSQSVARLAFEVPPNISFNDIQPDFAVISPDGKKIAFSGTTEGKNMLYVRDLDSSDAKLLPGSDNPLEPFWSPDSRSIAYGSNGKLKRSDLSGGNAQVLCDAARIVGGTWSKEGIIVFGPDYRTTLVQVPATGGEPQAIKITSEDPANERHNNPIFMPDGRHFLLRRGVGSGALAGSERVGVWAGSLDAPDIKEILPDDTNFVYTPEGWLVFVRNDTLFAQAFDSGKLVLSGEAIPIISGQKNAGGNNRRFSVSDNGMTRLARFMGTRLPANLVRSRRETSGRRRKCGKGRGRRGSALVTGRKEACLKTESAQHSVDHRSRKRNRSQAHERLCSNSRLVARWNKGRLQWRRWSLNKAVERSW
jgi:hypothetical protein